MTHKDLCCGILTVVLTVGLAAPPRADGLDAQGVLIVVGATTLAAAIAVVALFGVHHRRKKIAITGCVRSGEEGATIADEEDGKIYALSGDTTGTKSGDRMTLLGKVVKLKGVATTRGWETKKVITDYGLCQP
jgi:hypothetical protein